MELTTQVFLKISDRQVYCHIVQLLPQTTSIWIKTLICHLLVLHPYEQAACDKGRSLPSDPAVINPIAVAVDCNSEGIEEVLHLVRTLIDSLPSSSVTVVRFFLFLPSFVPFYSALSHAHAFFP